MRDMRFSQGYWWRFVSSGTWRRVGWYIRLYTDVWRDLFQPYSGQCKAVIPEDWTHNNVGLSVLYIKSINGLSVELCVEHRNIITLLMFPHGQFGLIMLSLYKRSRVSAVYTTASTIRGSIPGMGNSILYSPDRPDFLCDLPSAPNAFFPSGGKAARARNLLLTDVWCRG
jgi:hypothetical protein